MLKQSWYNIAIEQVLNDGRSSSTTDERSRQVCHYVALTNVTQRSKDLKVSKETTYK